MIAGPSEIAVVADGKTDLNEVLTSMISQAEHDSESMCVLITKYKPNAKIIGKIGGGNVVKIKLCEDEWCKIRIDKYTGWLKKNYIWGVLENENFN